MENLKRTIKKFNKVKRINISIGIVVNFIFLTIILWAFINEHENNLGEKIFLVLALFVLLYNLYIVFNFSMILPLPEVETEDSLKDYLLVKIERTIYALTEVEWRVLYPLSIVCSGILCMEVDTDRNIWKLLLGVFLFLGAAFWRVHWSIRFVKAKYLEITGKPHIKFFL